MLPNLGTTVNAPANPLKPPTVINLPELNPQFSGMMQYPTPTPQWGGASQVPQNPLSVLGMRPPNANPVTYPTNQPSGLGVSGAAGSVQNFRNPVAPVRPPESPLLALSRSRLDNVLGDGWADTFTAQHGGQDPITFFAKNFPHLAGNPQAQGNAALDYAEKYGKMIPNAVADWQQKHGNMPIPDEQWQQWHYQILNGGQPNYGGNGIDPYGVH